MGVVLINGKATADGRGKNGGPELVVFMTAVPAFRMTYMSRPDVERQLRDVAARQVMELYVKAGRGEKLTGPKTIDVDEREPHCIIVVLLHPDLACSTNHCLLNLVGQLFEEAAERESELALERRIEGVIRQRESKKEARAADQCDSFAVRNMGRAVPMPDQPAIRSRPGVDVETLAAEFKEFYDPRSCG